MGGRLRLVDYDSAWPARFRAEAERIRSVLGPLATRIEHVGSTAVPGLLGKPVLVVAVAVDSEPAADACVARLQALGYEYRGPYGDDPRRRYYVRDAAGQRVAQLHLYILPAPAWESKLAFRDALRADPALARAYAAEKRRVGDAVGWDKGAYAGAKGPFVEAALSELGHSSSVSDTPAHRAAMMRRKALGVVVGAVLLGATAGGYYYIQDRTFVLTFSEADIQSRLEAAPPFTRTFFGVVHVTLDDPRISLVEGSDRVRAGSDVAVRVGLGRREFVIPGSVDASGGVRFQAETGEFFLTDPVVEHLVIPGLSEQHAPRVADAVARALRVYYDRHPIYTLKPTDIEQATARLLLEDVRVVEQQLVVTLAL